MPSSKAAAIDALINTLRRITPPEYHHDLKSGARAYPTLLTPENLPFTPTSSERWAYCCVPLVLDQTKFIELEHARERIWIARIFGFVGQQRMERTLSTEVEDLANLEDDIMRAIALNDRLDGTVVDCVPLSVSSHAGWPTNSRRYGEMEVALQLRQVITADSLGPRGL